MKIKKTTSISVCSITALVAIIAATSSSENSGAKKFDMADPVDWEKVRAKHVAVTSSEWGKPEYVTASSPGWEEGVFISANGNSLYYIYTDFDVFRSSQGNTVYISGLNLDPAKSASHAFASGKQSAGVYPRADHFYVEKTEKGWTKPKPHPLTLKVGPIGGLHLVEKPSEGKTYAYFMHGFEDGYMDIEDIGYAILDHETNEWSKKMKIEAISSLEYVDSDPWVSSTNDEILFWSGRPSTKFKKKNIYRSIKKNGEWQSPTLLPAPINSNRDDMQTFIFGKYLYFSQANPKGSKMGNIAIFRSKKRPNNEWGPSEPVVHTEYGAVGEPSITADGELLYFEQIFWDGTKNFNPDIMVARREPRSVLE